MTLTVHFDDRPAVDRRGIGRYTRSLLAALHGEAERRGGQVVTSRRARGADLFHSPWIDGAPLRPRVPTVVTLHDVVPLKRPGEYLRSGLRFKMRYLAVQRASAVIVPTLAVGGEAEQLLNLTRSRLHVVGEAPDAAFAPRDAATVAEARARHELPDDYLVWVGGLRHPDPRKRVAAMADAPRDLPLVLVGETGHWARELPDVLLTGDVSDDDLAAIYTGARALVIPSDDEGFGLPAVEALACGTPVVACDVPALREVLGARASFVASDDLPGLFVQAAAVQRPAPPPPEFSWDDAARMTWDVYESAVAG